MKAIALLAVLVLNLIQPAHPAEKVVSNKSGTSTQLPTYEQQKIEAIASIEKFARAMAETDKDYASKEARLLAVIPMIGRTIPPDQWEYHLRFLYGALTEIDRKEKNVDADGLLSKYFKDEERKAPSDVFGLPNDEKSLLVSGRLQMLQKMLDSTEIDQTEHAARALAVALIYFPNDQRFVSLRRYRLDLVVQFNRGEIDKDRLDTLWSIRRREFDQVTSERNRAIEMQAAAQSQAQKSQTVSNILSGAVRGLSNASRDLQQRQRTSCTSFVSDGVVQTSCY